MLGLDDAYVLRTLRVLEISLIVAAILGIVAVVFPNLLGRRFSAFEAALSRFAESRGRAVAAIFLFVIVVRLLALPFLHIPVPGIHDEFSYLLMGDTFAHGRLANPTHPMWISFETFHVNWRPAYASMYPPGQGAALAVGELLGNPWFGVVLSVGVMCAAITWMLQAWLPSRWALLGGAMVALKLGVASYWVNSYWGGAVAATGGALVLGAMARIVRRARVRDALWLALGIAILANSRPYEGFLFCAPVAVWLLWWLAGKTKTRDAFATRFWRIAVPVAIVVALTICWMGYYNFRLTGDALLMPHVLNTRTYHSAQPFLWQKPLPALHYRNQQFEEFYNEWERENYHRGFADAAHVTWEKIFRGGVNYFWMGLLLALPGVPYALRGRKMRFPLVVLAMVLIGVFIVVWSAAHYAAPITCVLFLLIIQSVRHLRTMRWRGRPVGNCVVSRGGAVPGLRRGFLRGTRRVRSAVLAVRRRSEPHRHRETARSHSRQTFDRRALHRRSQHSRRLGLQRRGNRWSKSACGRANSMPSRMQSYWTILRIAKSGWSRPTRTTHISRHISADSAPKTPEDKDDQ